MYQILSHVVCYIACENVKGEPCLELTEHDIENRL